MEEDMKWPPPESIGAILSVLMFIRFYQRENERTDDDRYWPPGKFTELLMSLRRNVAPDLDAIPDGE